MRKEGVPCVWGRRMLNIPLHCSGRKKWMEESVCNKRLNINEDLALRNIRTFKNVRLKRILIKIRCNWENKVRKL
jgi:hypothetical protein